MKHKRSPEAEQRRAAREIAWKYSFQDQLRAETVNIVGPDFIYDLLAQQFPEITYSVVARFVRGEVLADSRGQGTMQTLEKCPKC